MTEFQWQRAQAIVIEALEQTTEDSAQLDMLVLAERAMAEAARRASYRDAAGKLHFEDFPGPLSDGLAFALGALRIEADGGNAADNRLQAATKLFEAAWSLMTRDEDIELYRQAAVAAMPELGEDKGPA